MNDDNVTETDAQACPEVDGTVLTSLRNYNALVQLGAVDFDERVVAIAMEFPTRCPVPRWAFEAFPWDRVPGVGVRTPGWEQWIARDWERFFSKAREDENVLKAFFTVRAMQGPGRLLAFVRAL